MKFFQNIGLHAQSLSLQGIHAYISFYMAGSHYF